MERRNFTTAPHWRTRPTHQPGTKCLRHRSLTDTYTPTTGAVTTRFKLVLRPRPLVCDMGTNYTVPVNLNARHPGTFRHGRNRPVDNVVPSLDASSTVSHRGSVLSSHDHRHLSRPTPLPPQGWRYSSCSVDPTQRSDHNLLRPLGLHSTNATDGQV